MKSKIIKELEAGRVVGPFTSLRFETLQVSPLGLVPKKQPGEYRVIHHLSYPEGSSINDGIMQDFKTVQYQNIDCAVNLIKQHGTGALLAKTDIESAFRLVPIHPDSHDLMGFKIGNFYFYDKTLPMGLGLSCQLFEEIATALHWIMLNKFNAPGLVHILDDFLFVGPPERNVCSDALDNFLCLCTNIGVPIKHTKTVKPCTCLTFLGIELDSEMMEARLPQDKLSKIKELLHKYLKCSKITLREIQSLVGVLNFACSVIVPGRCFLRRLISLTKGLRRPHHRVRLSASAKEDMRMWLTFIEQYNGKSLFLSDRWESSVSLKFFTDASNLGYGAIFQDRWFWGAWPESFQGYHITVKEFFPIVKALEVWGPFIANRCIEFYTDNAAVADIINSQTSKDKTLMKLLRRLVLYTLKHNILFRSIHISGKSNFLPDMLSRLQIPQFRKAAPGMRPKPEKMDLTSWLL